MDEVIPQNGEFRLPSVPRSYMANADVILYSNYIKDLGINQNLEYGDWYYVRDGTYGISKIFYKNDMNNFEDFEFLTNKDKYIRLISQEEALNVIRSLGYDYSFESPIITNALTGGVEISITNLFFGVTFKASSSTAHGAHVKAAYLAYLHRKTISDSNLKLKNHKEFGDTHVD